MTIVNRASLSQVIDGPNNTYCAAFTNFNAGTAATTDIFTLYGSATKIIRVVQISLGATIATAAAHFDLQVVTRSTVPTGGANTPVVGISQDPNDPVTTATNVATWQTPPTAGTLVGVQGNAKLFVPVTAANLNNTAQFNFGYNPGAKALVLRGVNSGMAITLAGATPANASSWDGYVIYTESDY